MDTGVVEFLYRFELEDQRVIEHSLRLDGVTLIHQLDARPLPEWTRLDYHQCPHCPLLVADVPRCPVASALADLLVFAGDINSFAPLRLTVVTRDRRVVAETTAQRAISSLMGLLMATSDCPHMAPLRPMARFHLPLASEEETLYRAASTYLLAQYFRFHRGGTPDFALAGLKTAYENLHVVNVSMAQRLSGTADKDASVNAVVLLDLLAKSLPDSIDETLVELEYLFAEPGMGERDSPDSTVS